MKIKPMTKNFAMPIRSTTHAGGYDIFMPREGKVEKDSVAIVPLGFAAEVPEGYVALLLPRSGAGFKYGVEVNNTVGVIDADFRGEWKAALKTKNGEPLEWVEGARLLQFILVPVHTPVLQLADDLSETGRGAGGFGSTGV